MREKWISLNFDQRDCPDHRRRSIWKRRRFNRWQWSKFRSLSIEGTFRMISTIDPEKTNWIEVRVTSFTHFRSSRLSRSLSNVDLEKREMWISLTFHRQERPNHLDSESRKHRDLVDDERSQFRSHSIDGIARDIRDRRSRIGSDAIQDKRSEFHSLPIEGIFRIVSTIDLDKINSGEEREVNFTYFKLTRWSKHSRRFM